MKPHSGADDTASGDTRTATGGPEIARTDRETGDAPDDLLEDQPTEHEPTEDELDEDEGRTEQEAEPAAEPVVDNGDTWMPSTAGTPWPKGVRERRL